MDDCLFAYGTLQFPEVIEAVCGRNFSGEPARLPGFVRLRIEGQSYPGIRAQEGGVTEGILYSGVDSDAISLLDRFEGGQYVRRSLLVETADGRKGRAAVYVVAEEHLADLSGEPWDPEVFRNQDLVSFLAEFSGWQR